MIQSNNTSFAPVSPGQRRNLLQWLHELAVEKKLRSISLDDELGENGERGSQPVALPFDTPANVEGAGAPKSVVLDGSTENEPPLATGQIRLLFPSVLPAAERPVYVAVLSEWEGNMVLLAPYSTFGAPAVSGELRTRSDDMPLRVLCLWNTRSVPKDIAGKSWFVDDLSEEELNDAWSVFEYAVAGTALPTALIDRTGAPILTADDPRIAYQEEENALLAPLTAAAVAAVEAAAAEYEPVTSPAFSQVAESGRMAARQARSFLQLPAWRTLSPELALAAGSADENLDMRVDIPLAERTLWIRVELHSDRKTCGVFVLDCDGNLSDCLDGACIEGSPNRQSRPIRKGQTTIPLDAVRDGFRLLDKNSEPIPLEGIE